MCSAAMMSMLTVILRKTSPRHVSFSVMFGPPSLQNPVGSMLSRASQPRRMLLGNVASTSCSRRSSTHSDVKLSSINPRMTLCTLALSLFDVSIFSPLCSCTMLDIQRLERID